MSRTLSLSQSASVTLNSNGNGTVSVGPGTPGHIWMPQSVTISQTGAFPATGSASMIPLVQIYAGNTQNASDLVDATYQVLGAASSVISGQAIYPGQTISAVFQYGNPGATATITVSGTRQVP
jgi:hypothetical protein